MPVQGEGGCGGFQRRSPTGGAAKGMPLNELIPPDSDPLIFPESISLTILFITFLRHGSVDGYKLNGKISIHRDFPYQLVKG
jgi:hypothetical protein